MGATPGSNKVFGVGLSRTGTTSLTAALRTLGHSAVHFPATDAQIAAHDAATDTPVALTYRDLDVRYPDSRFILTLRDKDGWLASCETFWRKNADSFAATPFIRRLHEALYGANDFEAERFAAAYDRHVAGVRAYFQDRPGDLLELDIFTEPDPWRPLCRLLGAAVPDEPFPHENRSAAVDAVLARLVARFASPDRVAALSGVSVDHCQRVPPAPPGAPAPDLDGGLEIVLILRRAATGLGGVAALSDALGVPAPTLAALLDGEAR